MILLKIYKIEKQGTTLSQDEFKNLRQSRRKKLDEEFNRNQTNRKRQQKIDFQDSRKRSGQVVSDQKKGLATESQIAEQIQRRFKEFKELGNAFNPKEIQKLRDAQKSQRKEEFDRELKNLKIQKAHELEDVQTNLDEGLAKAAAGLSSAAEMNQLISQSIETFIEKGTDMSLISEKVKALKIEEQNKRFDTLNNRMEAFRKGMGNINDVMSNLQQNIDALVLDKGVNQFDERVSTIAAQAREANSLALEDYTRQFQVTEKLYAEGAVSLDYLKGKIAQLNDQAMKTGDYDATNFFASIREEFTYGQEQYYRDLDTMGRDFVRDFKGGIAGAFGEAIRGTKSLKQAFAEMFANLADKMLDKSLNMAVNSAFGALGFQQFSKGGHVKGYNSGGIVKGGSGVKDDVPAYLSRGEYVIRKKTVNEYGKNFFDSLNSAKVIAANRGGIINNTKLTAEAADRVFGGKARNMAALQAEKQRRMAALQRAGIESYGYKEATDQTKKDLFGRDTGQKILSNRVGFRLDFGKPLNERRVRDIENAVKAYPEIGPFIDPDIFKRSTVEIGGGATKLKLKNSFIYNETKRPDQGRFIADPRLSSLALNDENNPQNKYKFEKADNFFNYQKDRLEYYAEKQKELQDFQDQKANRRRSFLFGAAALLFAGRGFAKGGQNKEDDIPALLTGGEYVVRKGIVDKYGLNFFENLNRGKISAFNKGGYVAPVTGARPTTEFEGGESRASGVDNVSNTNNISISVNVDNAGAVTTETKQGGSTSTNPQSQEEAKRLGDQIKSAVVNVIVEQKRPGGMLYGTPGSV
jgi:hypothetical protein